MKCSAEGGKELFWVGIKKVWVKARLLVCENGWLLKSARKGLCKRKFFGLRKRPVFSAHAKPPKMKSFFQHTTAPTSHYTKANEQPHISSATTYCELAVHLFIFEKHRSCVCTAVTLSHRFKAFSPAFCGQNRFWHVPPENFANSLPAEL